MGFIINGNEFTSKSTSPKLIGETFTTLRTGIIDGAVEQDGSQYNFSDYPDIKVLLENNELPYINTGKFDYIVSKQGGCDCFGYNVASGTFYGWSSTMQGDWYTKSETPQVGDDLFKKQYGVMEKVDTVYEIREDPYRIVIDGDGHSATRETSLDETIPASTYFKVPKKVYRVLVRSQKPTADNDYTWYNLYSDGWCEQGCGRHSGLEVTLPINMSNTEYTCLINTQYNNTGAAVYNDLGFVTKTVTRFTKAGNASVFAWTVKGYASSLEVLDDWDQNVKYERYMIQIK